jgi:hypothetical protein
VVKRRDRQAVEPPTRIHNTGHVVLPQATAVAVRPVAQPGCEGD